VITTAAVVLALAAPAPAAAPADAPLRAADLQRLRAVTSVASSPDGATLAFTLSVPRDPLQEKDGRNRSELWVVSGSDGPRPFVTGDADVSSIGFLSDGRLLGFLAKRDGDRARSLYVMPVAGGEARKVVDSETDLAAWSFHPGGRRLAFVAAPPADPARRRAQELGFDAEVFDEEWTPARLWLVDFDAPGAAPTLVDVPGHLSDVEWSADGSRLLATVAPTPSVDDSYMRKKLVVVDAQSGKVVASVKHAGKLGTAAIAPDAARVAFVGAQDEHDPAAGRLFIADAATGEASELLPDFQGHFAEVAFADPITLVYVADRGCETLLGRIHVDGSGNQELLAEPGLVLTSFALSRDGRKAALIAQSSSFPPELFRCDLGGPRSRITHSNPWLDSATLAHQETFRWKARDGLDLEGVLISPLGRSEGQRAPLILAVHGGPESCVKNGWLTSYSSPGQIAAAAGYAVLYPNYRGSTGRGIAFSVADQKDPAGKEFDDLVDAVDALVRSGLVDEKRVGITGGSYGGYATAWCCTRYSDRFAAGVMGFGMSDLISMVGTTEIPDEHYLVHHRLHPWEDWKLFLERSPIYHVTACKTPLLILAGKADPRVPPSQSLELYHDLKAAGHKAVRLVQYPGEKHGNARAASRLDYHLRMMQWFDTFLKGDGKMPPPRIDEASALGTTATKSG
jgi:dipeptidyl aminopeptidase/acylaminoacyl peptidase